VTPEHRRAIDVRLPKQKSVGETTRIVQGLIR